MSIVKANSLHIPLKDESVHCCITSPPYYGLRRYLIQPTIWDGDPACDHVWGKEIPGDPRGGSGPNAKEAYVKAEGENEAKSVYARQETRGNFCQRCGSWKGQLGGEPSIALYCSHLVQIFREVRRVLRPDGCLWLNLGDSFAQARGHGHWECRSGKGDEHGQKATQRWADMDAADIGMKPKDLCEIPSEVVRALRDDGWYLRARIPWIKSNCMPSSCTDRPTIATEYIFLLTKSRRYFYDTESVRMPAGRVKPHGKNSRRNVDRDPAHLPPYRSEARKDLRSPTYSHHRSSIPGGQDLRADVVGSRYRRDSDWFFDSLKGLISDGDGNPLALIVNPQPYKGAHYACFPEKLVEPMIQAGSSERGCCPKCGAPWTRVIEKETVKPKDYEGKWSETDPQSSGRRILANVRARREAGGEHDNPFPSPKTIGWEPSCKCNAGKPVSCVILDPFGGTGTVGAVAERLNRKAILLDLGYHTLQKQRLRGIQKELPI